MIARISGWLLLAAALTLPAGAQTGAEGADPYAAALSRLVEAPADRQRSFDLAKAAVASGRVREAIAALERLLRIDPTLANIKLELGVLYLQVGSPARAEFYLADALADPAAPPDVRARGEELLTQARAQQDPVRYSGAIRLGIRAETNANAAPGGGSIIIRGVTFDLEDSATDQPDESVFVALRGRADVDLGTQAGHGVYAEGSYFGTRHSDQTQLNLHVMGLEFGATYLPSPENAPDLVLNPYIVGDVIYKDEELFEVDAGAGLRLFSEIWDTVGSRTQIEVLSTQFNNTTEDPENDLNDGYLYRFDQDLRWQVTNRVALSAGAFYGRNVADAGFESYRETGARTGVSVRHASPFGLTRRSWRSGLNLRYRYRAFDEPDEAISDSKRRDNRVDARLSTSIPVARRVRLGASFAYAFNGSTEDINQFENLFGFVTIGYTF